VETGKPIGLAKDHVGDRTSVCLVRLAALAGLPPMPLCQDARNLKYRRGSSACEDTEGVPVAPRAFEAPLSTTEPLADS
jgi:hypothetical protein